MGERGRGGCDWGQHTHTHTYTHARARTHARTHAPTHTRAHTHAHTHTHARTHTHAHAHTRVVQAALDEEEFVPGAGEKVEVDGVIRMVDVPVVTPKNEILVGIH